MKHSNTKRQNDRHNRWMKRTGRLHGMQYTGGRKTPEAARRAFLRPPYYSTSAAREEGNDDS